MIDSVEELIDSALEFLKDLRRKQRSVLLSQPMLASPRPVKVEVEKPKVSLKAAPKVVKKAVEVKKEKVVLEQTAPSRPQPPSSSVAELIHRALPNLFLHPSIPDDLIARKMASEWKDKQALPEVPVMVTRELAGHRNFLKGLSHAIDRRFAASRTVEITKYEEQNRWETMLTGDQLRLIIIPDIILWKMPNLLSHYKECPGEQLQKLGDIPTLLLPDLNLYQKDPLLKKSLWSLIQNALQ